MTGACLATESFWTNVHTMESNQDAAGLLSWGPRALARLRPLLGDGSCGLVVCLLHFRILRFFASGVILELQTVLGGMVN